MPKAASSPIMSVELSDLTPRIQVLRQRQDQLQSAKEELEDEFADRKVELADLKIVENYANDLRNLLSQSSLAEQKAFIRSFVTDIKVTDGEVDLFYTIPLPHDGTVHDRAEVPSIIQLGSGGWIRTNDLRVMSPTSFHCSTPRRHYIT